MIKIIAITSLLTTLIISVLFGSWILYSHFKRKKEENIKSEQIEKKVKEDLGKLLADMMVEYKIPFPNPQPTTTSQTVLEK